MKKIFYAICIIVVASFAALCYSQNKTYTDAERSALLARSDSLFAVGVDLYNAGKYTEAIPIFTESDKIDKAVLDSTSNRRDYSAMWLASCYYKLNDTATAAQLNPQYYMVAPIDRRLTIQSDSLIALANEAYANKDINGTLANVRGCAYPKKRHDSVHV
jgi:hypothetical protein